MKILLTLLLLLTSPVWAAPHKCVIDNKTEYRDTPCPPGTEKPLQDKPQLDVSPTNRQEALKRLETDKQRARTLERNRLDKQQSAEPKKTTETEPKKNTEVTPEEGAKQGAAGRTYQKERPPAQPQVLPQK
jgi:hypothetical protein